MYQAGVEERPFRDSQSNAALSVNTIYLNTELNQDQLVAALDEWVGAEIAVRVVGGGDERLGVCRRRLGGFTSAKHPALFWPVGDSGPGSERSGVYLHPELFEQAAVREGAFV